MKTRVMIVDDSSVVRQVMQDLLAHCHDIEVIATASDPIFAMGKMRVAWPDVIVLDIEMPRMDGITFLRQIMAIRPTPVIICSTLTEKNAGITMEALAAGAVGIITKPSLGVRDFLHDSSDDLIAAIRAAAQARVVRPAHAAEHAPAGAAAFPAFPALTAAPVAVVHEPAAIVHVSAQPLQNAAPGTPFKGIRPLPRTFTDGNHASDHARLSADAVLSAPGLADGYQPATPKIVAIGVSTGGPQALEYVLRGLSPHCPGIVIVQHMPEHFTKSFAQRLNGLSQAEVVEAQHLDLVLPGRVLIAPGGMHVVVKRDGVQYYVEVVNGPLVSRHKPSVDVLFRSVAKAAGRNAVGIIMTGMGDDGARGMKELSDRGAATYAQDEASSVVFGMPKEAIQLGGVGDVISLENISAVIGRYGS
ncbi:chemotaxis response regulator protein-glutamate methylesterase [Herbaspirillum lusitanum]|uniref:Protein-glutamate methylesterase/protein-glutamine glutaminase n=1 Tax=Herbaspirillum lusitanum TaxID=213312 RepID=A0ABW9A688_9BURK